MDMHIPNLGRIRNRAGAADPDAGEARVSRRRARQPLRRLKLSIRDKILLALLIVVCLMSAPYIFLIVPGMEYKAQYDTIIQNITTANSINGYIKPSIDAEMWEIIAGKEPFSQGRQYIILDDVDQRVQQMISTNDLEKGRVKLSVIERTLRTLRQEIDQVGIQIAAHKTFDENLVLMEQIRSVTQLIEDNVQEYALFEVNQTQQQYETMQTGFTGWAIGGLGMIVAAILFSIVATWRITKSIYAPIKQLHDVTTTIARRDLENLVTTDNADEITELGMSFNIMVGKIKDLLDATGQWPLLLRLVNKILVDQARSTSNLTRSARQLRDQLRHRALEVDNLTGAAWRSLDVDDPRQRKPDITRAREILGWQPKVNRKDGLKITYDYFKNLPQEEWSKLPKEFVSMK